MHSSDHRATVSNMSQQRKILPAQMKELTKVTDKPASYEEKGKVSSRHQASKVSHRQAMLVAPLHRPTN